MNKDIQFLVEAYASIHTPIIQEGRKREIELGDLTLGLSSTDSDMDASIDEIESSIAKAKQKAQEVQQKWKGSLQLIKMGIKIDHYPEEGDTFYKIVGIFEETPNSTPSEPAGHAGSVLAGPKYAKKQRFSPMG